jgi:glycosyltransferase involved in cell wall biosynthesis
MSDRAIHVAMLIQVYLPHVGGAERQLAALAPLLREHNVKVSVITRQLSGYKLYEEIEGTPVYRIPGLPHKALTSLFYTAASIPLLIRLNPDLLHAHELLSPTTTAVFAKSLLKKPVVAKILRGGELGDIGKLKSKATGAARLQRFSKDVDTFISISHEISSELAELGVDSAKQAFIPNGVDDQKYRPLDDAEKAEFRQKLGLEPDNRYVIFTGRLEPEKRIDLLLELWSRLRERFPDVNLLLVGTGSCEAQYKQMGIEAVQFLGQRENVHEYLQAADIFILPSMTEGLSNALLEAMASGLAAVATNVGGTPDVLSHLKSGYIIEPGNAESIFTALTILLEDKNLRKELGSAARQFVQKNYALAATADKLRALYERVLSKKEARS